MSTTASTMQEISLASLIPAALLILVGLLLWGAGRRVLRPGFAMVGLIVGLGIGWVVGYEVNLGIPPWIVAGFVGLTLACLAALFYRAAVAGALAIVFAVAGLLAVVMADEVRLEVRSGPTGEVEEAPSNPDLDDLTAFFSEEPSDAGPGPAAEEDPFQLSQRAEEGFAYVRGYAEAQWQRLRAWWEETPDRLRPTMIGAALLAGLIGLLLGTLARDLSAAVVTSFGGALLCLANAQILLELLGMSTAWLPESTMVQLIVWIVVGLAGILIQWTFRPKPADNPG